MNNPWGRSGSNMNPLVRAVVCLVTGLAIGLIIPRLPTPLNGIAIGLLAIGMLVFVIHTELWLRKSKKELDAAYDEFLASTREEKDHRRA